MLSESSSANMRSDIRSSAAEQRQQHQGDATADTTGRETAGGETAGGDAPEETVRIRTLKRVRYEITLDEIAGCVIAVSIYSNIGEKNGSTTRKKSDFRGTRTQY